MAAELAVTEGALESRDKLAAKDATEHLDWKKERVARFDPACTIDRKSTGGNYAMHMRVMFELLIPGVQHAEETDIRAEMLGIASNFEECFRTGSEQQIVHELLILQGQWRQPTR